MYLMEDINLKDLYDTVLFELLSTLEGLKDSIDDVEVKNEDE